MPAILSPNAKQQFFTDGSTVAAGYKLYTYAANTTTPQATFQNRAGDVPNANPIILDARGEAIIYLTPGVVYDYVLKTPDDATVWTREDVIADAGDADAVSYIALGTGAVSRAVQDKLRERISGEDFSVAADGVTDDTLAMTNALAAAKASKRPLYLPAGTIKTSAVLDISGATIIGVAQGYRNADGTIIEGSGNHDGLSQVTVNADDLHISLQNIRIKNVDWGVKVRYMLHSHWENVFITDSDNGIQFGNSSDSGGLFDRFDNIEVDVTDTALDINGNQFVNANTFNSCFFRGGQYGARLRCNGGIGAVNNVFNATEFLGAKIGIELENTSNTVFNQPYLESNGPAIYCVGTRNIGVTINEGTYGELKNNNTTGKLAFIYHAGVGACTMTVNGGYIYLPADPLTSGLSFVASESPGTFSLVMHDRPELDVTASSFTVLNGLQSSRCSIVEAPTAYASVWSAPTPPSLGNGTFSSSYTRSGNICTVNIQLVAGSTTSFGTGDWTFTVPYLAAAAASGAARAFDSGTGYNFGIVGIEAGQNVVFIVRPGTAELFDSNSPQVWAVGDALNISITYPC
jgi:hypothetical protein